MIRKLFLSLLLFLIFDTNQAHATTEKYTYERMKQDMIDLANTYQLELKKIGQSELGREILAVKVGEGSHSIFITGSHHGREWLTTHVIMNMIEKYAEGYEKNQTLYGHSLRVFDDISVWFIPMVNPDGVVIQQEGISNLPFLLQEVYLDMNNGENDFSRWKANGLGVDLNRQWPAGWAQIEGNQRYASYSHYKGEKPVEALETKALLGFTNEIQPLTSASYHTSGRMIYWYYFNGLEHLQRDVELVEKVADKTGYQISYPPTNAIGGGYTDWFIQTYKKPALTIELSYSVNETSPPLSVLEEEWQRNKEIGIILAEYAKAELLE